MTDLDWRSMFQRYADLVAGEEGVDFISSWLENGELEGPADYSVAGPDQPDVPPRLFTPDELLAIRSALGIERAFSGAVAGFLNLETIDGRIIRELTTQWTGHQARPTVGQDGVTIYYVDVSSTGVITATGRIANGKSGYLSIGLSDSKIANLARLEADVRRPEPALQPHFEMTGHLAYLTLTDRPCWPGLTYLEGFPADA